MGKFKQVKTMLLSYKLTQDLMVKSHKLKGNIDGYIVL